MGLAPADLLARHPRLVACSITGFGHTGPWKNEPGYDLAIQALSGLMSVTGPTEGPPSKVGVAMADILTGMYAAVGILAGLRARETSGHGYHIDLALLDCAIAAQINLAQAYLLTGHVPPRPGNTHFQIVPYALFAAADGWVVLNVGNDSQWRHFCAAAEAPDLAADPRFATNPAPGPAPRRAVPEAQRPVPARGPWPTGARRLETAKVPHAPVNDYAAVFANEQVLSRGMKVRVTDPAGKPVDLLGSPFHWTGADLADADVPAEARRAHRGRLAGRARPGRKPGGRAAAGRGRRVARIDCLQTHTPPCNDVVILATTRALRRQYSVTTRDVGRELSGRPIRRRGRVHLLPPGGGGL